MALTKLARKISWYYVGRSKNGDPVSGTIEAATAIIARVKLRKQDILPLSLKQCSGLSWFSRLFQSAKATSTEEARLNLVTNRASWRDIHELVNTAIKDKSSKKKSKRPLKDKEITLFVKQFGMVIKSGVPLLKAFDIVIQGQENKKFVLILEEIKFAVANGLSLSESFGAYPKVFDPLFINFLAIGEQGGILEAVLLRYVEYKEKTDAIKQRVKAALAYPAIVALVSVLVLALILGFVVPQFQQIFSNMGAKLPLATRIVIAAADLVVHYWWLVIMLITAAGYALLVAYAKLARWRFFVDSAIFSVPLFGELAQKVLISRWTRSLSLLFAAGVPLNDALRSIAFLVNNYLYGAATLKIQKDVEGGSSLYNAMLISAVFPNMVNQMVAVGEEAGSLEVVLKSVADYYDQEVEMVVETLLSLIEPATIIILGSILGSIIVAIYLPLFNLGNLVG